MGSIRVSTFGSFPVLASKDFSAEDGGHADAVGRAIAFLVVEVLPASIRKDHALHESQEFPKRAFGHGVRVGDDG